MTELYCAEGHVIDAGRDTCSRCNGVAVNAPVAEVIAEAKPKSTRAPRKAKKAKKETVLGKVKNFLKK